MRTQPCAGLDNGPKAPEQWDLCYQFFRHDYHPSLVHERIVALQAVKPRPVVAHFEGKWPLVRLARGEYVVYQYRKDFAPIRQMLGAAITLDDYPIVVVDGDAQFQLVVSALALDASKYHLDRDTGHFKIFTVD